MRPFSPEAWNAFLEQLAKIISAGAWPATLLAIFWLLRAPISSLIGSAARFGDRIKKVSHGETSLEAEPQSQKEVGEPSSSLAKVSVDEPLLPEIPYSDLVWGDDVEARYGDALNKVRSDLAGLGEPPPDDLVQRFMFALAEAYREITFLRMLRVIHGSQLELLVRMASSITVDADAIESVYQHHMDRAGEGAKSKAEWFRFIQYYNLVDGNPEFGAQLTPFGRDFVQYAEQVGDKWWFKIW